MLPGRAHAADRVLEQRVAGEHVAVDHQREHPRRVARACAAARTVRPPISTSSPASRSPVAPGTRSSGWTSTAASGQRSSASPELGDVVVVVVGEQDVRDGQVVLARPRRTAGRAGRPRRRGTRRRRARPRRGRCWRASHRSSSVRRSCAGGYAPTPWNSSTPATASATSTAPSRSTRRSASRSAAGCRSATRRSTSSWACPGDGDRLELTYNHGVDSYELGTGYNHIALTVDDLDGTLERARPARASSPRSRPTACARAARASASCAIPTATGSS